MYVHLTCLVRICFRVCELEGGCQATECFKELRFSESNAFRGHANLLQAPDFLESGSVQSVSCMPILIQRFNRAFSVGTSMGVLNSLDIFLRLALSP